MISIFRIILQQTNSRNDYSHNQLFRHGKGGIPFLQIISKNSKIILKNGSHDVTGESECEELECPNWE